MFALITKLSLAAGSARFCYSVSGNVNKCPADTISVTPETFSTWSSKIPNGSDSVEFYIVDSLEKDKIINPSDIKSYITTISIIGQINGQKAYLNTTKNPFVEELDVKNIELVITTDTISYDSVTLKDVILTSTNSKTIHTTARSIAGDLASISAINKGIDASQGSFLVGDLKTNEDKDLWFHSDSNVEYEFSNVNKNLNITILPNIIDMQVESGHHIRLHILSRLPKFTLEHTVSGVSVTFNEIGNVGARFFNCFNIILGSGSILNYPESIDVLGTPSVITPAQDSTPIIKQGGKNLPLSIKHSSGIEYQVFGEATIPVIDADKATIKYEGNAEDVAIAQLIPGTQLTATGENMTVNIDTIAPENEFKLDGTASYHIKQLTATKAVTVSNLIIANDTKIIVDASKSAKVSADKLTIKEAGTVNILLDDTLAEGTYTAFSAPSIDCSKLNLQMNGISASSEYELRHFNAKAQCAANSITVELKPREVEKGTIFCIAKGGCPEAEIAVTNEEEFGNWLTHLPEAAKEVHINIYGDILEGGKDLVFDFGSRTGLDVTIESKGVQKNSAPVIAATSLNGAIERLHLSGAVFGVSGATETSKLRLPYLELSATATLTKEFHDGLDSTSQEEYTVAASADSDFTNFSPKLLSVSFQTKECIVRFRDNLWQLSTSEFSFDINSAGQKLALSGATEWELIGDGTNLGPASIDASADGATVKVSGEWPSEFKGIELKNGHNAVYTIDCDSTPFTIETALPPSFFELKAEKSVVDLKSLYVRSNAVFSRSAKVGHLEMAAGSGVAVANSASIVDVTNLTVAEAADVRIPAEVKAQRLEVGLGASVVVEQADAFPKNLDIDYALPLAPLVTVVGATPGDAKVSFRYINDGSDATRERRIALKTAPLDVVCGASLNCSGWALSAEGPVSASCYAHEERGVTCVRLTVKQLDEPLNAKEITIIVVFTLAVVGGILACIFCCRRKKDDMYKTVDAGQQLLD